MSRRDAALAAAALAAVLSLGACATPATQTGGPSTGPATYEALTEAYLGYARCARAHGMPDLPDPVVDRRGNDSYPQLDAGGHWSWPRSVLDGCASAWDAVRAVRDRYDAEHGLSARATATKDPMAALAFSRCVRLHGFPAFPDPAPDGGIATMPPGWTKPSLSPEARAAIAACTTGTRHG